jgi:hypothetical protein
MRRFALALALAACAAGTLVADSSTASLRVGVSVTRRCVVTSGATPQVRCTRVAGASAAPLVIPAELPARTFRSSSPATSSSPAVVTVLF